MRRHGDGRRLLERDVGRLPREPGSRGRTRTRPRRRPRCRRPRRPAASPAHVVGRPLRPPRPGRRPPTCTSADAARSRSPKSSPVTPYHSTGLTDARARGRAPDGRRRSGQRRLRGARGHRASRSARGRSPSSSYCRGRSWRGAPGSGDVGRDAARAQRQAFPQTSACEIVVSDGTCSWRKRTP